MYWLSRAQASQGVGLACERANDDAISSCSAVSLPDCGGECSVTSDARLATEALHIAYDIVAGAGNEALDKIVVAQEARAAAGRGGCVARSRARQR